MKGDSIKTVSVLGTGWLGFPLSEYLVSQGFSVKGSTRSTDRLDLIQQKKIEPFIVDVANSTFGLQRFYDSNTIIINIPFKGVEEYSELIAKIEKSKIQTVIFISSTSVYGNKQGVITEEDHDYLMPCALLEIEHLFTSNNHFSTTIVRFGGLIGYSRNPALFFKKGRLIKSPESNVNMIHRDDCINIIHLIIEKQTWGKIYNCCSDSHPTKREFYTHAAMNSELPIPGFSEINENSYKMIGNSKVKKDLEYEFIHPDLLNLHFLKATC